MEQRPGYISSYLIILYVACAEIVIARDRGYIVTSIPLHAKEEVYNSSLTLLQSFLSTKLNQRLSSDVTSIGGGPAGFTTAAKLAQQVHTVVVLKRSVY
jgi:hypothetical protein